MLPPSGEFPMLEKLTVSGNIADLGILLDGCPRLRVLHVTLCRMGIRSLKAALKSLEKAALLGLVLATLGFEIPWRDDITMSRFAYLLRTVERLSPEELVITDNFDSCRTTYDKQIRANLPCFANAKSIKMSLSIICFKSLKSGEFSKLERLSLRICSTVDIGTLVTCCPRLRALKVTVSTGKLTVHSASMQKLDVNWHPDTECHGVDIVAPKLEQLHVKVRANWDIGVSISTPMLENVSWQCLYIGSPLVFGSWCLESFRVQTMENVMCLHLIPDVCIYLSLLNLPLDLHTRFYFVQCVMSCSNVLQSQLDAELDFAHEVKKFPVTNFSMLEIHFEHAWHVYGGLVLQLLQMRRITIKKLKLVLSRFWPEVILRYPYTCSVSNYKMF
jgi:hypothetical protein